MTETRRRRIIVVGAGIVGVSAALWLQRDGHHVTIVDRLGPGEGASYGNGGVLAASSILPVTGPALPRAIPKLLFGRGSPLFMRWSYLPRLTPWLIRYMRACSAEETRRIAGALASITADSFDQHIALARGTPAEHWLKASHYLYAYKDRAAFEAEAFGWAIRKAAGFRWDELDGAALRASEPLLGDSLRFGISLSNHGFVGDPGRYVGDLAAAFERGGGIVRRVETTAIIVEGGQAVGVAAGGARMDAECVVLAAGAWSGPLARSAGLQAPLESERGYHLELLEPSVMPRAPIMIAAGKFVVTPMDGRIRLAGFVEFGGIDAPPNRRAFAQLQRLAKAAMPGLTWRGTPEWLGHRPAPADSIPVIGEAPGAAGLFAAFGHHHIGLTAGPKTGRMVADLVAGRRPNIDLAPYSPARFYRPGKTGRSP